MYKNSNLYPFTNCDIALVEELLGHGVQEGQHGYMLINNHLVPYSFLEKLRDALSDEVFHYDAVLSPTEILGASFLETLDDAERQVFMPCLLALIEQGYMAIAFHGKSDIDPAMPNSGHRKSVSFKGVKFRVASQ